MARPTKLTSHLADDIATRLRSGVPRVMAAESLGIHRDAFHNWMQLGLAARECEKDGCDAVHHGPVADGINGDATVSYADFADMVMRAEADAVVLNVGYVQTAAKRDPRSAQWWLERRHPGLFKQPERVELSGPGGGPIEVQGEARDRLGGKIEAIARRLLEQVGEEPKA
jgi:hypothetical protein